MKVAVLCKSDQAGGAAVTSRRLTEALIAQGIDATLLVEEKKTALKFVDATNMSLLEKYAFLKERLHIYVSDGFSRKNLFRIDTGEAGLPLWRNPVVKEADAVIINWVNQGMLSLKGVDKICRMGKKILWVMHDMWNFTGICHHSMGCKHYESECGNCFLLGRKASPTDLSHKIWEKKKKLYDKADIDFVAVSSWLEGLARKSSLLHNRKIHLIHNAFPQQTVSGEKHDPYGLLFIAARLDDPIKGIETLREGLRILAGKYPELARKVTLHLIGGVKDEKNIRDFAVNAQWHGRIDSPAKMKKVYEGAAVVISTSHFENLPGTLVEGQAYGCVPIAFDRGGQKDIIDHLSTGYLMPWSDDILQRGEVLAEGLAWALSCPDDIREKMRENVESKFSYNKIAGDYVRIFKKSFDKSQKR